MSKISRFDRKLTWASGTAMFAMALTTALAQTQSTDLTGLGPVAAPNPSGWVVKATGEIEIVWPGGKGGMVPPGEEKLACAQFEAFPRVDPDADLGEFRYLVFNPDTEMTLHREIVAELIRVEVDLQLRKAYFIGVVASDTKGCGGSGSSHDAGCDGDCSGGEDDGHDGGCSGGGTGGTQPPSDGGCTGSDGTTHDVGCTGGDGTTHNGGCTGSDGSTHDGGCSGGGSEGGSRSVSGRESRVGQVVVVKVHDGGTPAINGDGITWRWFAPMTSEAELLAWLVRDLVGNCPHLCKKTVIGGNLVVHSLPVY